MPGVVIELREAERPLVHHPPVLGDQENSTRNKPAYGAFYQRVRRGDAERQAAVENGGRARRSEPSAGKSC